MRESTRSDDQCEQGNPHSYINSLTQPNEVVNRPGSQGERHAALQSLTPLFDLVIRERTDASGDMGKHEKVRH